MAQYKIKKGYIIDTLSEVTTQILEQRDKKINEYNNLPWYKKSWQKRLIAQSYKLNDIFFIKEHLTACLMTSGNFVIMDEAECFKIQKLWKEYCYDLKK